MIINKQLHPQAKVPKKWNLINLLVFHHTERNILNLTFFIQLRKVVLWRIRLKLSINQKQDSRWESIKNSSISVMNRQSKCLIQMKIIIKDTFLRRILFLSTLLWRLLHNKLSQEERVLNVREKGNVKMAFYKEYQE